MSITNSSAARRAGFRLNDAAIADDAAIAMTKIGTRTLRIPLPAQAWVGSGSSVAIAADGVFNAFTLPNANTGELFTSVRLPAEWDSGDITLNIYWKSAGVSGDVKFSVELASVVVGETLALDDTQTGTTTVDATANKLNLSSVTFAAALLASGDLLGIHITRDPADGSDTLASDVSFVGAEVEFTGRG